MRQLLLPVAHADHTNDGVIINNPAAYGGSYWPCAWYPRDGGTGSQHSPNLSFHNTPDDTYKIGDTIVIRSDIIEGVLSPKSVYPNTRLALETGDVDRFAVYFDENGETQAFYRYTVQPGDYSDDLGYRAPNALHWGLPQGEHMYKNLPQAGTHKRAINCWLSTPGASDYTPTAPPYLSPTVPSLSFGRNVVVDGIIPRVESVTMASGAYGAGSQNVTVNFGEAVFVYGPPPSLVIALDGENKTIPYLDGNETSSLVFNYEVMPVDLADDLDYAGAGALVPASGGTLTDYAGNNASLALPEPGSPGSLGATSDVSITAASGEVAAVGSPLPDDTYPAGYRIEAAVNFTEPAVYSGAAPPSLVLNLSGSNRTASYASGNDTRSFVFAYTVQEGDPQVARLDYAGAGALQAGEGGLRDRAGDAVDSVLPWQGGAGQLASSRSIAIDAAAAAYVTGVGLPGGDSAYKLGDTVRIAVDFSAPVAVTGAPALALATDPPRSASYAGGGGTRTLEFSYTVQQGDAAAGLDYAGVQALSLGGGAAIRLGMQGGGSGAAALLTLPAPGGPGSLGHARGIAIDGTAPAAVGAASASPDGTYGTGSIVSITVAFDEPVVVEGEPALRLATVPPRNASYAGGSGTAELAFWYTVQPGDSAPRLGYADKDALALEGGASAIRDVAGNAANLTLPAPGSNRSLAASARIDVHGGEAPVIAAASRITQQASSVLGEPNAVTVFEAGNRTYAAVTSWQQKGVQIVQIHEDGTMSAVASATDSQAEFGKLDGPTGAAAFGVGNYTYVMVVSGWQNGAANGDTVQLIRMHKNGTLDAPGTPSWLDARQGHRLNDASGVDFLELPGESGNRTYAIVAASAPTWASWARGGVQLVRVHENGTLEAADSINHNAANTALGGAKAVDAFEMAVNRTHAGTFAIVAALNDNGVQLVRVHENGTLEAVSRLVTGNGAELRGAIDVDTFKMSGNLTYAIVAARSGDAVQLIRVHENGTLSAAGLLRDSPSLTLDRPNYVSAFAMGGRTYAAVTAQDDNGIQLIRVHENGTLSAAGMVVKGPGFYGLDDTIGIDTLEVGNFTYAIVTALTNVPNPSDGGAANRANGAVWLIRLSPASVESVSTSLPDGGKYRKGHRFNVTVGFDLPVSVSDPPPSLMLSVGETGARLAAEYLEGDGTDSLVFNYTVGPGDNASGALRHAGAGSLAMLGAVADAQGKGPSNRLVMPPSRGDVVVDLFDPGRGPAAADLDLPGSPGLLRDVLFDGVAPRVESVSSPDADDTYGAGRTINITVSFTEPVNVTGSPRIGLDVGGPGGRYATYEPGGSGSGGGNSRTLAFSYIVLPDDLAGDLEYGGTTALDPGGGTIRDAIGNDADLALPEPGSAGSLGHSKDIEINATGPAHPDEPTRVLQVFSTNARGTYSAGSAVNITVVFNRAVNVTGMPLLALSTDPPRSAEYAGGMNTTSRLAFLYFVRDGDSAALLEYANRTALSLNNGSVRDSAGSNADLELPPPGSPRSLSAYTEINIDGVAPRIESVSSPNANGTYGTGSVINVMVAFDKPVLVTGSPRIGLDVVPGGRYATYEPGGGDSRTLVFSYIVLPGDLAGDLEYGGTTALDPGSGTIRDAAGNYANLTLPEPGSAGSLGHSSDLEINATAPAHPDEPTRVLQVFSTNASGTYIVGSAVNITVALNRAVNVTGMPLLALSTDPPRSAEYAGGMNATSRLAFLYAVRDGDSAALLKYANRTALSLNNGTIRDAAGSNADLELPPPGSPRSLSAYTEIAIDGIAPRVESVSSPNANGTYAAGRTIDITVSFTEPVSVAGTPLLALSTDPERSAEYAGGASVPAANLAFRYTVRDGDSAALLEYANRTALSLNNGTIRDAAGNPANLTLARPGEAGSLSAYTEINIDGVAPRVESVSSPDANGTYAAGRTIDITVSFTEPVSVAGTPLLALLTDPERSAEYVRGTDGDDRLAFRYAVRDGDSAALLEYANRTALSLNNGTIRDAAGNPANLTLARPGEAGSLSAYAEIGIDGIAPRVESVSSPDANGTYGAGSTINITVALDEPVLVTGSPRIGLDVAGLDGRPATYDSGNDTRTLRFTYLVLPDELAGDLEYSGVGALDPGGGTIRDAAGNDADLELPEPGSAGSLGHSKDIAINATGPAHPDEPTRVFQVFSPDASGTYGAGSIVNITVAFNRDVNVTGTPLLALSTDPPRSAEYVRGTDGDDRLAFLYAVRGGDSADLLEYANRTALFLNGGTILGAGGSGTRLDLPPIGSAGSLGASGIGIDGIAPRVESVSSPDANGTYGAGRTINITVSFTEPVNVTGSPRIGLDVEPDGRHAAYEPGGGGGGDSRTLAFSYFVLPDDLAGDLEYGGTAALDPGGGTIRDAAGNDADLELPEPGSAGSLGHSRDIAINATGPAHPDDPTRVFQVFSPDASGTYGAGSTVNITVAFNRAVNVTGTPLLALSTDPPRSAEYVRGTDGDARLAFLYAVRGGDSAGRLEYANRTALFLNNGTIRDAAGSDADLALPELGSARSLGASGIAIGDTGDADGTGSNGTGSNGTGSNGTGSNGTGSNGTGSNGTGSNGTGSNGTGSNGTGSNGTGSNGTDPPAPTVMSVQIRARGAASLVQYSAGQTVLIDVEFSAPVAVRASSSGATPYLELRTGSAGARAAYASGNNTDTLGFEYEVRGGDLTGRLSYSESSALILNGSEIVAASGSTGAAASVALPEPGAPGSLSAPGGPAAQIDPEPGRPVLDIGILDEAGGSGHVSRAAHAAAAAFNELQGLAAGALIVNATSYDVGGSAAAESAASALRAAHSSGAGPSVYVGPSTDRGLHAAMPYAAENNIVLVSAGSTAPSLAVEGDTVFRLLPSGRLEAEALARLALNEGAESLHVVLENATHGPPTPAGQTLEDATPPPPGRFSHAFDAALAYAGVPSLSGTVTLGGADGSHEAAAAAAALAASVGSSPAAVVYTGSPQGLAALAEASASHPNLALATWLATGLSAESALLAGDGPAATFAAQADLSAARWSPPANDMARDIDSLLVSTGADAGSRHSAYAAYDAVLVIGKAAAGARGGDGTVDAAEIADLIPEAAAEYTGALGDIALDFAGDLWVPAEYGLWTVARAAVGTAPVWSQQPDALDEERACSIALTRAKIDYGPIDSGQTSRPHLQTIVNTGQLPFSRVDLTATPWHVDSPGGCAPGSQPSLPVGLSEIRTELGGQFLDLAGSGTVLAQGLGAGGQAPLWYRLSLAGYADLPQAQITQCATYVVRCG